MKPPGFYLAIDHAHGNAEQQRGFLGRTIGTTDPHCAHMT